MEFKFTPESIGAFIAMPNPWHICWNCETKILKVYLLGIGFGVPTYYHKRIKASYT